MPRIRPLIKPKPPVKADHVGDLIQRYKRDRKKTWDEIGSRMGLRPGSTRVKMARGTDKFTVEDMRKLCKVLDIPPEEMGEALAANIKEEQKWAH